MNSCLYECQVMHTRFSPRRHRFLYRIFMLAIDLDELEALHRRLRYFSVNRANLYSFRETDFFPAVAPSHPGPDGTCHLPSDTSGGGLKARVASFLRARGVDLGGGRVVLVTLPRVLGYLFNPVSFYFCFDRRGEAVAALAEVTNTFREMKPYFLAPETKRPEDGAFHRRMPKYFYVSPYSEVDVDFDFTLRVPGETLAVQIDDYSAGNRTLTSTLAGPRRALTDARLLWFSLKYPLITLKIILLIHWHALRLWLKRVPWFAKGARPEDQRELYRPHPSISPVKTSDLS